MIHAGLFFLSKSLGKILLNLWKNEKSEYQMETLGHFYIFIGDSVFFVKILLNLIFQGIDGDALYF